MIRTIRKTRSHAFQSWLALSIVALLLLGNVPASARDPAIISGRDIFHPVFAPRGMVSSQEATATGIGVDILKKGGNAVDAAVAVGFALAVTLPRAGNIGGGGFMMVHMAESGKTVAIDYREMAPAGATGNMYLDAEGNVDKKRARFSYLSVGVPGTVAGLAVQDGNLADVDRRTGERVTVAELAAYARDPLHLDYVFWGTEEPYWSDEVLPYLRSLR
jgi:hypothetical protein